MSDIFSDIFKSIISSKSFKDVIGKAIDEVSTENKFDDEVAGIAKTILTEVNYCYSCKKSTFLQTTRDSDGKT